MTSINTTSTTTTTNNNPKRQAITMTTMKAIVLNTLTGELTYTEHFPIPTIQPGEALIKVLMAGICGTDLTMIKDAYKGRREGQIILGHEFVGNIVQVKRQQDEILIGKRVVAEINIQGCLLDENKCTCCSKGGIFQRNHCENRCVVGIFGANGGFAEYVKIPIMNIHILPDNNDTIPNEVFCFVEPAAAAFRILEQLDDLFHSNGTKYVDPSKKSCVGLFGDGKLASLICQVLLTRFNHVTCIGKHQHKLDLIRLLCGTTNKLETMEVNNFQQIHPNKKFDIVIDATGRPTSVQLAAQHTCNGGILLLKTTCGGTETATTQTNDASMLFRELFNDIVVRELLVVGSRCGPFEPSINALQNKIVNVLPLINSSTSIFELKDMKNAFETAEKGNKVLFRF
jgi:threonine dehydrogenase-like Zn-dependent dehydrogenase